jgi:hypothetical protein
MGVSSTRVGDHRGSARTVQPIHRVLKDLHGGGLAGAVYPEKNTAKILKKT